MWTHVPHILFTWMLTHIPHILFTYIYEHIRGFVTQTCIHDHTIFGCMINHSGIGVYEHTSQPFCLPIIRGFVTQTRIHDHTILVCMVNHYWIDGCAHTSLKSYVIINVIHEICIVFNMCQTYMKAHSVFTLYYETYWVCMWHYMW